MPVSLTPDVQELLQEELRAFADAFPADARPAGVAALVAAVAAGELPDELPDALPDALPGPVGHLLEPGLQTGRSRHVHRASGEPALLRLFARTPAGTAHATAVAEVNAALARLAGQELETVRVVLRTPGTDLLQLGTDDGGMTLRSATEGAGVERGALGV